MYNMIDEIKNYELSLFDAFFPSAFLSLLFAISFILSMISSFFIMITVQNDEINNYNSNLFDVSLFFNPVTSICIADLILFSINSKYKSINEEAKR